MSDEGRLILDEYVFCKDKKLIIKVKLVDWRFERATPTLF